MRHARLLDCTLRDGAYLIDKQFGNETIIGIIENLVKAKIDFIEIGCRFAEFLYPLKIYNITLVYYCKFLR